MEAQRKYETPAERRFRLLAQQTLDTGNGLGPGPRPTLHPRTAKCSLHPTGCPTESTPGQMHSRIRELRYLVARLEAEMPQIESADIIEPAVWSSVALMLREVANRSLLLRRRALELAAEALELDLQTSRALGLFE